MSESNPKGDLRHYLQEARDALVWKLDGLSEYDIRRPLTPTGTNLLGLVKHVTGVEQGYLGSTFGRPMAESWPGLALDAPANADMWATADESRDQIVGLYRRTWQHSDATVEALPLETVGQVPWWPAERNRATLHHLVVRVIADTQRHAGHADILRELCDGTAGRQDGNLDLPTDDADWWRAYRDQVEQAAVAAEQTAGRSPGGSGPND
jgi:hypothetical protein